MERGGGVSESEKNGESWEVENGKRGEREE